MSLIRFFRRSRWDDERARELEAYLDLETQDNIARGMTPDDARYAARRKLGNATLVREEIYQMNSIALIETIWQDLRYGARLLRLNPGFALVAVLSLALGVGANTAIFQLLNAVRLRTLPVSRPHELAQIELADMNGARGSFNTWRPSVTNPLWEQIRDRQQAFSAVTAWSDGGFALTGSGEPRTARALWVSGDFFRVLGVGTVRGRVFTAADDRRGCDAPGTVISYGFWQAQFGGDPAIVGRTITLSGRPFDVIGVAPAEFFGVEIGRTFDVAVPLCADALFRLANSRLDAGTTWWLTVMGRLNAGWSLQRAAAHLESISPGIFQAALPGNYPPVSVKHFLDSKLTALPAGTGVSQLREAYSSPLVLLLAIAAMVLLIACANLANLLLARASVRQREIAVRLAIGASRRRVIRQLLAESLLLASVGGGLGVVLARELSRFLVTFVSETNSPWILDLGLDWRVLGFTMLLTALTCVLFGLAPAMRATRADPVTALKNAGRGLTDSREKFGVRRALVVAQVALSLVLLVGAMMFARSLNNLLTADLGLQPRGILVANVGFARANVPAERRNAFKRDLVERLRAVPGVESAAEAAIVPLSGSAWGNGTWMEGPQDGPRTNASLNRVGPGYFQMLATPLVAGRDFGDHDTATSPPVAIVNEAFARELTGGASPVGRRMRVEATPYDPETAYEIVGLVKNTKYSTLRDDFGPIVFLAASQDPHPGSNVDLVIRSRAPLAALTLSVKAAIAGVNPNSGLALWSLETRIHESLLRERLMATLSGFFGGLAALLATIGLYGVMSYMVARRRNEIGIRMALGASRGAVLALIMREAAWLVGVGVAVGTVLAIALARTADTLLFGMRPGDPVSLLLAAGSLAAVAAVASWLPARRAAGLEPTIALRDE